MSIFELKLSQDTLPNHIQASLPVVWDGQGAGATIHLQNEEDSLRTLRVCARRLFSMVNGDISLVGQWSLEQQWAFAGSFGGPKSSARVQWVNNEDSAELENMYQAFSFARDIVNQSPEVLSPESLASQAMDWISSLAPDHISVNTIVGEALQQSGWHGIYEVGRGSVRPPVMLEIDYNPTGNKDADIDVALVGKGITFDSGGYSMKTSEGMLDMKCDMGGAATVTAALGLAIMQGVKKRIKLFLCCAENLVSGHAYKLGDIITYKNGTTVEIVNTDAEGRLVLADGLMAATESGASIIVDAATLTGAAVMALGRDYNALFSMDSALRDEFLSLSETVNEPHWALPLTPLHRSKCPSPFADTANSNPKKGGGAGGASNAAGFLSRFVRKDGKGWLHVDLAAAYNRDGSDVMPSGGTGIGIRSISALLRK